MSARGATSEPAIAIEGVSFRYPGGESLAVETIDLVVARGERLGVLGPNGGGKSTLLGLMLGQLVPTEGRVRVLGGEPREASRRGRIAWVAQRSNLELAFPVCAREVVGMPLRIARKPWQRLASDQRERVERAMDLVDALGYANKPVGSLSGGQLQRVLIARAVVVEPEVLLLDEPMTGVDVSGQRRFGELIARLHGELGLTIVTVSHDLRAIAAGSDRVACLNRTLHSHGAPEGLTPQVLAEVFEHDVAGVFGEVHVRAHLAEECTDPSHRGDGAGPSHGCCGGEGDAAHAHD